jgi:serine/threonine protein kinase
MAKIFTIAEGLENMGALRTGGQGSVYKGRRMGQIITAVKILPTPIHDESEVDKNYLNFVNEVEKLKKVNEVPNPHVVKILNSGIAESGSLPFIEMEFIEGPDLGDLLQPPHDAVFTIKEVIKVADQLASALAHCHKVGVKHGDIKSNNIKFNIHSGNYVLLDFGLSVMSDEQRRSSMRHAGAIEFMAPEQNEGQMLFQTDVYSYGLILYELLAGQVPFPLKDNGETARNAVMIAHLEKPVPDVLEVRKKNIPENWTPNQREREMLVPGWLLRLINKCLEKSPEDRYADGMALQDMLIENSIAENSNELADTIGFLKAENDNLKVRVLHYQGEIDAQKAKVSLSRPLFAGMLALMLFAVSFGGYSWLSKKTITPVLKDTSLLKTAPVSQPIAVQHPAPKKFIDSIAYKDSVQKSIEKKKASAAAKKKHKPKRKKFLGIF